MTHIINLIMSYRLSSNKLLIASLVMLMIGTALATGEYETSVHFSANPSTTDSKWPSSINKGLNMSYVTLDFLGGMKLYYSNVSTSPRPIYNYS